MHVYFFVVKLWWVAPCIVYLGIKVSSFSFNNISCYNLQSGRSRSRGRDEGGESPDSSSLGSSSHANDSMDSGSETRRSSPNLPPSPPHDSEVAEQRMGRNGQTPNHYRKSLPPLNDVFASQILRYLHLFTLNAKGVSYVALILCQHQFKKDFHSCFQL